LRSKPAGSCTRGGKVLSLIELRDIINREEIIDFRMIISESEKNDDVSAVNAASVSLGG
jgi:hypothetical protein